MKKYTSKPVSYTDLAVTRQKSDDSAPAYRSKITVGGASIFTLLVVMCLGVFALITVTASTRELSLSNRAAASSKNYYEAQFLGEELLQKIQNVYDTEKNLRKLELWVNKNEPDVETKYKRGELTLKFTQESEDVILYAQIAASKNKIGKVVWETESKNTWTTAPLPVWDGNLPDDMFDGNPPADMFDGNPPDDVFDGNPPPDVMTENIPLDNTAEVNLHFDTNE